jgi:hypothetical protein
MADVHLSKEQLLYLGHRMREPAQFAMQAFPLELLVAAMPGHVIRMIAWADIGRKLQKAAVRKGPWIVGVKMKPNEVRIALKFVLHAFVRTNRDPSAHAFERRVLVSAMLAMIHPAFPVRGRRAPPVPLPLAMEIERWAASDRGRPSPRVIFDRFRHRGLTRAQAQKVLVPGRLIRELVALRPRSVEALFSE